MFTDAKVYNLDKFLGRNYDFRFLIYVQKVKEFTKTNCRSQILKTKFALFDIHYLHGS